MSVKQAAGFVIFRKVSKNIEYLLLQTSYGIHHWTPPKGHLDGNENEMEAALRETKEEAGLDKADLKLYDFKKVLNYEAFGKPKVVTYFLAELKDPNREINLSNEHQDYKWLTFQEACKLSEFKEMQETFVYFDEILNKS